MPDFFADSLDAGRAALSAEDSHHALRVLRLKPGDALRVSIHGRRYGAVLEAEGGRAFARLGQEMNTSEARTRITLYQGWPKGDKMDQIVRQATELGVHAIMPVLFTRCVARPEQPDKKVERLNRIAREAAMQSGRTLIPEVGLPILAAGLPERLARHELALVAYELEGSRKLVDVAHGALDTALVIGPEGGLTEEEIALMGALPVTLGPRILRTETAGIAAIAMLLALNYDD